MKNMMLKTIFTIIFLSLLISEYFLTFNVYLDLGQDALMLMLFAIFARELEKNKITKDPLNANKLDLELLKQENKQLQQKIQTLEAALNKVSA